jgi:hypothetical protein
MKTVKLTIAENSSLLYLNIDHIVGFSTATNDTSKTYIVTDEDCYLVNENIDDVLFLVSE